MTSIRLPESSNPSYSIADFLDDQRRVARAARRRNLADRDTVDTLDGCLRVVHADALREALDLPEVASVFNAKYQGSEGPAHLRRFALVVDFLDGHRSDMVRCDLGRDQTDAVEVREELLRYLLSYPVAPGERQLPDAALGRFVDEWGHRWL